MLVAQASGAQVESFCFAIYSEGNRMDIRHPAPIGVAFGVANVVTKLG